MNGKKQTWMFRTSKLINAANKHENMNAKKNY